MNVKDLQNKLIYIIFDYKYNIKMSMLDEKIIITCKKMLNNRGYEIIEEEENKHLIGENKTEKICVFLYPVDKLKIKKINEYMNIANNMDIKHYIIIYTDSITSSANKLIQSSVQLNIIIETFYSKSLMYDITEHKLVPKHIRLEEKEAEEFKNKYGIKIPKILTTDPVSKYYNYKVGDIIRILRPQNVISYRIVV